MFNQPGEIISSNMAISMRHVNALRKDEVRIKARDTGKYKGTAYIHTPSCIRSLYIIMVYGGTMYV